MSDAIFPACVGIVNMAIAPPAQYADHRCAIETPPKRPACRAWAVSRTLAISVVICAVTAAGCARNPAPRELDAARHEIKASRPAAISRAPRSEPRRFSELRINRPDPVLLTPQPAPDCELKRSNAGAVDPDQWARLKVEFERECYQKAEKAARDRLALLQAAGTCEIEPTRKQRPAP
jgi:hypothetical protein